MNREAMENKLLNVAVKATLKARKTSDKLLTSRTGKILLCLPFVLSCMAAMSMVAFAATDGKQFVNSVFETVKEWVGIIGGVCIIFGGIKFGMAIKDDDEPGRGRALLTIAGGAVVTAMANLVSFSA